LARATSLKQRDFIDTGERTMTATRAAHAATIALLTALMLAGCGRKGPLDIPPPRDAAQTGDETGETPERGRRFILDPLIE